MAPVLTRILVLVLLAFPAVAMAKSDEADPQELLIRMDGELLTVEATEVPQRRILEGLARHLGFELIVAGPLEERRSLTLYRKPPEEALKKALFPANWVFVYRPAAGESRLAKVFVFPLKPETASPRPPGRARSPTSRVPAQALLGKGTPFASGQHEGVGAALAALIAADDEETRAIALFGLVALGGEHAVEALMEALHDEEAWIRETAVEALAELGGEQAIQWLQQALQDEDDGVRQAAKEALGRLLPGSQ